MTKSLPNAGYEVKVLSNIVTSQLNEILEYTIRINGVSAVVKSGDYDNIVQDSLKYNKSNLVIIFWELCNMIDGLQYKIELFDDNQFNAILEKTKSAIDLVFKNLEKTSLVLFNKFTSLQFSNSNIRKKILN